MLYTNALLADGRVVDIEADVTTGLITAVSWASADGPSPVASVTGSVIEPESARHDLGGWLVLPAMAEPHAHLDKALTADLVPNPAGDLMGAIDAWTEAARAGRIDHDGTVARASTAIEMLLTRGVTAVRSHVNVGAGYGAAQVNAVHQARTPLAGLIDVQTVALVHSPLTGDEGAGNRIALDQAIEAGVDLVGGCPHLEPDPESMIDHVIATATAAGLAIDLHVDETLDRTMLTLPELARRIMAAGFSHQVAASHCVSLGVQSAAVQAEVAAVVAQAGVAVFALPQTNLFLQGRDNPTAMPRGLTAIDALTDAGALVGAGGDNVQDPFNLVGRSDPLETAALMVMAGHRRPEVAYDMVSNAPRRAMGLAEVNFEPGDPADFMAIDAPTVRAAIADAPMSRRTIKGGRLVASTDQHSAIHQN